MVRSCKVLSYRALSSHYKTTADGRTVALARRGVLPTTRNAGMLDGDEWKPRARDDVIFRKTGDEWLLYDPNTDDIHVLNLSAALAWTLCTGDNDVDEIQRQVEEAFLTSSVNSDVSEIIDEFQAAGLFFE